MTGCSGIANLRSTPQARSKRLQACKIELSLLLCPVRHIRWSIWGWPSRESSKERLQIMRTLCTGSDYPIVATYITWGADQVLYGSYPLELYSYDIGCVYLHQIVFLEMKHKQRNMVVPHYCTAIRDSHIP